MSWWGSWSEPPYRSPRRDPADVVTDTLMLELSWQLREAERQQRERDKEYRRLQTGVDYSWLANTPRSTFDISQGERLMLEDLCSKVHPSYCGAVMLRFRQAVVENEPETQEVTALFRSVVVEALDRMREEEEAQRLARQWNNKRAVSSMSLMSFKSRVRINPFGSSLGLASAAGQGAALGDLKTVSEDVEKGPEGPSKVQRMWSMPDFRQKGLSSKVV